MPEYSEDVTIAVALTERLQLENPDRWANMMDGPSHSQPYLYDQALESLTGLQGWLEAHVADPDTQVLAAVSNFARVLDDFLYVFDHDLEIIGPHLNRFRQWYKVPGHPHDFAEGENYSVHVLLTRNLVIELTRALNLVRSRARDADPSALQSAPQAVVDTGAQHAPYQAASYSVDEARSAYPYPGLRAFPRVMGHRDIGTLGVNGLTQLPREPGDFERWIDQLATQDGPPPGGEPPEGTAVLPVALPRPVDHQPIVLEGGSSSPGLLGPEVAFALGITGPAGLVVSAFGAEGLQAILWAAVISLGLTGVLAVAVRLFGTARGIGRTRVRLRWWLLAVVLFGLAAVLLL
ncbi:MAG: hypothetical protein ITG02_00355 [Patulibacter sp.]|nr:hypothetical protein [Patulibacter sp.]